MSSPVEQQLRDQAPFVWFVRVRLPPLGWLFVLAALVVAVEQAVELAALPRNVGPSSVGALALVWSVAVVSLPAALLWRVPYAARRHPLLLAGLALAALAIVGRALIALARLDPDAAWVASGALLWIGTAGPLLVGIGLLRLRGRASRLGWLAAVVALFLVDPIGSILSGNALLDVGALILPTAATLVLAFAAWVPVSAWLDGDQPRAFWALLALAVPLYGLRVLLALPLLWLPGAQAAELSAVVSPLASVLTAIAAVTALLAYGRYAPRR